MIDNKNIFSFPIGYHQFHKKQLFNFQLNRWYSLGYSKFEDLVEVGDRIKNFLSPTMVLFCLPSKLIPIMKN